MAEQISVVHGEIENQAKNLADMKNQIEQMLTSAKKQVDTLRESGGFKSGAGDSFQHTYDEWTVANHKSVELLGDMATYLTKASNAFAELDANFTLK